MTGSLADGIERDLAQLLHDRALQVTVDDDEGWEQIQRRLDRRAPQLRPRRVLLAAAAIATVLGIAAAIAGAGGGRVRLTTPASRPPAASQGHDRQIAEASVRSQGRVVQESVGFGDGDVLEAIDSMPDGGATGRLRRVSFFVGGRSVGNDGAQESTMSTIRRVDRSTVAVTYTLWRDTDQMCCPTGGTATVRYRWSAVGLRALDPVPPYDGRVRR